MRPSLFRIRALVALFLAVPVVLTVNAAIPSTVVAWGFNGFGQTTVPAGLGGVTAIAAGGYHTVALKNGAPPAITTQPTALAVTVTSNATFTVTATGTDPLAYQWRKDGVNLASATTAALSLVAVQFNQAGSYSVVITNLYGSVTSSAAALTVNVPVSITQQPQSIVTGLGSNAVFTVSASGTAPLTYRWYWQPGNSRTALAVPDVRNDFVVGAAVLSGGGFYPSIPAVQILAGAGSGVTATATVNNGVVTAVNILSAGSGYPSNAVLQIDPPVAGTTQLLSGQTATNLSLPALGALASGSYFVVVTNAGGSVTSSLAMLRVLVPQRFVQPPQRLGDGAFRLLFGAHDGGFLLTNDLASLEVWGSTNVANTNAWVRITNGISVLNGQVQVDDSDSPGLPRRFYRVITR